MINRKAERDSGNQPKAPTGRDRQTPAVVKKDDGGAKIDVGKMPAQIREATLHAHDRMSKRRARVQVTVEKTGPNAYTHSAAEGFHPALSAMQIGDAFGTTSTAFKDRTLSQIVTVMNGQTERKAEQDANVALAVLDGAKPENEIEAMLIAQMVVTNETAMNCLAQVGKGFVEHTEVFGNLGIKLLRTYTAQAEALAKLRRKGEQTVKVVHVYPGGQAVVGDVHHHPREEGAQSKSEDRPCGTEELAISTALPSPDPQGFGVPIPGHAERPVPAPRRAVTRRPGKSERAQARAVEPGGDRDQAGAADNAS